MVDVIEIILPVVFFSEIGDGLNCVCGGARDTHTILRKCSGISKCNLSRTG